MGFLSRLWNAGRKAKAQRSFDLTNMSEDELRDFLRIGGSMSSMSGAVVNETTAMRVAAAWRCVQIISGAVAILPVDLIRRVDENRRAPAVGHSLRRVLTVKPNHWQTSSEFRRMMQSHLLLRGNAYALKGMSGRDLESLIPLHPDRVSVEQQPDMSLLYRVTLKNGGYRRYSQREILHLRGMSLDGITGLSVLSHAREALGLALQAERAGANLFTKGALAGGVLQHPNKLSADAFERLKASWQQTAGAEHAGETKILEEGMNYQQLSISSRDAQFLENRDFQRYDIAMFFGVPPHMLGATEKQTSWGSGIEQQGIAFVTYTLNDWLVTWQESIKRDLLQEGEWESLDVRFYTQGLLRGDFKARWDGYVKALQWGVYSPNEVRRLEDDNPRDGGDVYYDPPNTAGGAEDQKAPITSDDGDK
jgi:HK97 family phage portal protein